MDTAPGFILTLAIAQGNKLMVFHWERRGEERNCLVGMLLTGGINLSPLQVNRTWAPQLPYHCWRAAAQRDKWVGSWSKEERQRGELPHPSAGAAMTSRVMSAVIS